MKRLLILRHARAPAAHAGIDDQERPLDDVGRRQASLVGRSLLEEALVPDRIISSSALRARETAQLVAGDCGYAGELILTDRLYAEDVEDWLLLLGEQPANLGSVMLVGHNPGLEVLLEKLTRRGEGLTPASLACIELPIEGWSDLHSGVRGSLRGTWRP